MATDFPHLILDQDDALVGPPATALFSPCRTYRYALTRTWDDRPPAVFLMLNPSTANAFQLDPTVRRCVGFARRWGHGGLVVLNAFALRSTDPRGLRTVDDPVGPDNDQVIADVLTGHPGPVVVAWGAEPYVTATGRDRELAELLRAARPVCLGLTAAGHPRHPLYVRGDAAPIPFPTE